MEWKYVFCFIGAFGLLMFGMRVFRSSIAELAGGIVARLNCNIGGGRINCFCTGASTSLFLCNSDDAYSLAAGHANAGVFSLKQTAAYVIGAGIGASVIPLLLALPLEVLIYVLSVAFFLSLFSGIDKLKASGGVLFAFAIMLFSIRGMTYSLLTFNNSGYFILLMKGMEDILPAILMGIGIGALLQNKLLSFALLQAIVATGLISLTGAVYIMLGLHVGSCAVLLFVYYKDSYNARRAMLVLMLSAVTAAVLYGAVMLLLPFGEFVNSMLSLKYSADISGLQIAICHLLLCVIMTPFVSLLSPLYERMILVLLPGYDNEPSSICERQFDIRHCVVPQLAYMQLYSDMQRMAKSVNDNYFASVRLLFQRDLLVANQIISANLAIGNLKKSIISGVALIPHKLSGGYSRLPIGSLSDLVNCLSNINEQCIRIMNIAVIRGEGKVKLSKKTEQELLHVSGCVSAIVGQMLNELLHGNCEEDTEAALLFQRSELDRDIAAFRNRRAEIMAEGKCSAKNGLTYFDLLDSFQSIADNALDVITNKAY